MSGPKMYSEAQQHLGMLNLHLLQMIARDSLLWEMCDSHLCCYLDACKITLFTGSNTLKLASGRLSYTSVVISSG